MKLRTKIQLFSSLFMLILILLINTSIYFLFQRISLTNEVNYLQQHTETIAETLQENPDLPKNNLLNAFLPQNGMIRIISAEDESILLLTKDQQYRNIPTTFHRSETQRVITNEEKIHVAMVTKPLIWDDGEVVMLEISDHLYTLKDTMTTLFYVLFVASLVMIIPTVIAGSLLGRFLLQPIQQLTSTMKENIQHGQWQKIDLKNRPHDELFEMETTYNMMMDELRESFEKQEVFVSNASHELKTPISIVKSYAQLLKRRGKEHPQVFDESVQSIDSEADRMQNLVEQLLALAQSEAKMTYEKVDLIPLTEEIVQNFTRAYGREIELQTDLSSFIIKGQQDPLKQILYILMDNALKYSDDQILIKISQGETTAMIQVIDFGEGIPEKEQKYLFDRFYRLDEARSRKTGGTGLGLAIAQSIAQAHQGKVSVTSEVGKGSTFTVSLPIEPKHEKS